MKTSFKTLISMLKDQLVELGYPGPKHMIRDDGHVQIYGQELLQLLKLVPIKTLTCNPYRISGMSAAQKPAVIQKTIPAL